MPLLIGEVSQRSGLSHDTLRYYEKLGLVEAPQRDTTGRRRYPPSVLDLLGVIGDLRRAGFSLDQVASVLSVKEENRESGARVAAMRIALDALEADLDARARAIGASRELLASWRREPDTVQTTGDAATTRSTECPAMRTMSQEAR